MGGALPVTAKAAKSRLNRNISNTLALFGGRGRQDRLVPLLELNHDQFGFMLRSSRHGAFPLAHASAQ
jgi:hypothetical protein